MNKQYLRKLINEALGNRSSEFVVNGKKVDSDTAWKDFLAVTETTLILTHLEKQVELLLNSRVLNLSYTPEGKKFLAELKKTYSDCKNAHKVASSLFTLMGSSFKGMGYDVYNQAVKNFKNYASKL